MGVLFLKLQYDNRERIILQIQYARIAGYIWYRQRKMTRRQLLQQHRFLAKYIYEDILQHITFALYQARVQCRLREIIKRRMMSRDVPVFTQGPRANHADRFVWEIFTIICSTSRNESLSEFVATRPSGDGITLQKFFTGEVEEDSTMKSMEFGYVLQMNVRET
jgi:hypothetical protein